MCWGVIIPLGRLRTGDAELYRYLRRSVNQFDGAADFQQPTAATTVSPACAAQTMPGWQRNVVHTFLARGTAMTDHA